MRKNIKKKALLSFAAASAIIAPMATVVACSKDKHKSTGYKKGEDNYIDNILSEKKATPEADKKDLTVYKNRALYVLYEKEVDASRTLQISDFNFQIFENNLKIAADRKEKKKKEERKRVIEHITEANRSDDEKAELHDLPSQIRSLTNAINSTSDNTKGLKDKIARLKRSDWKTWDSKEYNYEFPKLLKPIDKLKEDKAAVFYDRRDSFQRSGDREQGAEKWPTELAKSYGGAKNDNEAIDFLVSQQVQQTGINTLKFKINDTYDIKHYIFAKLKNDDDVFPFLNRDRASVHISSDYADDIDAFIKAHPLPTLDNKKDEGDDSQAQKDAGTQWEDFNEEINFIQHIADKVYFISNSSPSTLPIQRDSSGAIVKDSKRTEAEFIGDILDKGQKLINVHDGIIPFVRGAKPNEPWKIEEAQLKRLLQYDNQGHMLLSYFFDDKLFKDDAVGSTTNEDFTTSVLHFGKVDGTSDNQGLLGIKSPLQYVKEMAPGFGLGVLELEDGTTPTDTPFNGGKLVTDIETAIKGLLKDELGIDWGTTDTDSANFHQRNRDVLALFDHFTAEKAAPILEKIGGVVRDHFARISGGASTPNREDIHLVYKIGTTGNYLVTSKFGLHIINIFENPNAVKGVKLDLDKMAKEQDPKKSSTQIVSLLNQKYAKDDNFLDYVKANYQVELTNEIKKYNSALPSDHKDDEVLSIDKMENIIESIRRFETEKEISEALAGKVEWLKKEHDDMLMQYSTLAPDKIYEWAQTVSKQTSGTTTGTTGTTGTISHTRRAYQGGN